ncbi:hypothetical protein BJ138DRAFT_1097980 [Hygrophoropsis aurantiaca]|uniref:Uncharacterized protein n=1 Tax=Hygrophoropsis aurantiaca TaxID=72124 RepID=A0ACB8AS91_9AGAM|nr:hypothetical protein BJ138DRAFT_1097980 [Hygrophoropsis aurantiaca]
MNSVPLELLGNHGLRVEYFSDHRRFPQKAFKSSNTPKLVLARVGEPIDCGLIDHIIHRRHEIITSVTRPISKIVNDLNDLRRNTKTAAHPSMSYTWSSNIEVDDKYPGLAHHAALENSISRGSQYAVDAMIMAQPDSATQEVAKASVIYRVNHKESLADSVTKSSIHICSRRLPDYGYHYARTSYRVSRKSPTLSPNAYLEH